MTRSPWGAAAAAAGQAIAPLREHEQLLMISISTVLVMAGQGVIAPVLPAFAKEFGVGAATVGLTLSLFALARLILNVPLGVLSDRYGRRVLLVGGPIVTALGMAGSGIAGSIGELLAWRFVAGAGSAMYMTGAMIYLTDISTPQTRARFIGTNQGALLLGVSIGPAVGGGLAALFDLRVPFYAVGGSALIAAVYAYWRLPETRPERRPPAAAQPGAPRPPREWLAMIRSRGFAAVSLVTFSIFFTRTASRQTIVPLLADARLAMSTATLRGVFTMMSIVNVALVAPASILADRYGRKAVIGPSGVVAALGLALFAVSGSIGLFLLAAVILALGSSLAGPAPAAYAADIAPENSRGLAMGLYRSTGDLGFVIGPPLLGWFADQTSFGAALSANAILMGAAAIVFVMLAPEVVKRVREAPPPTVETPVAEAPATQRA